VVTGIKRQLSSSRFQFDPFVSTWLHPRGDGYGARWAASLGYGISEAFWELIGHRVIAGISSSWARIGDGSPATSALLRLLPRSNWLAITGIGIAELELRPRGVLPCAAF